MKIATPPTPAPTSEAAPPPAAGPAHSDAPADDFMALLAQIATASVSGAASQATSESLGTTIKADKDEDTEGDIASLLPIAFPLLQLELPKDTAVTNADAEDAVEALL